MAIRVVPSQLPKDVFINFRGEELRGNFISHLVAALDASKINYYIDRDELRGEPLKVLFERIEQCKIALTIFSSRYGESNWCLNELGKIMRRVEERKLKVIPIFFNVTPGDVRIQVGEFGRNLLEGGRDDLPEMVQWRKDLKSVVSHMGMHLSQYPDEHTFKVQIIIEVKRVLSTIPSVSRANMFSTLAFNFSSVIFERLRATLPPYEQRLNQLEEISDFSSDVAKTNADLLDSKVKPPQIQVFINFRGIQLRNNFLGYLTHAFQRSEVNVFIDNYEKMGEDVNTLFKRIEDSGIAIVVFSRNYTESNWCLQELVKIKERVNQGLLKVLPIFYKVSPTDVKRLKGEFGEHFRDKEYRYGYDSPLIKAWKEAILFATEKHALVYDDHRHGLEVDFVERIVKEVLEMLQSISAVESGQSSR